MKFNEFLSEEELEQLYEGDFKRKLRLGTLALAALAGAEHHVGHNPKLSDFIGSRTSPYGQNKPRDNPRDTGKSQIGYSNNDTPEMLAKKITKKYKKVDPKLALAVAELAKKHEKPVFPKAADILSIVGIESSFRPDAVSDLVKDPAIGLTQIRPGKNNLDPVRLKTDIEHQIEQSSAILNKNYRLLKDEEAAIISYNVGRAAYKQGKYTQDYITKFKKEKELYNK